VEPARTFAAEWTYEPPVESLEQLLFRLRRFADMVALELRAAGLVTDRLTLTLVLEDETEHQREFRLPEPTGDADVWLRVLHSHLETVRTDAAVSAVRLIAAPTRPPEKQDGLFETGLRDRRAFWENLAKVAALLGEDRVGTPLPLDTWQPDAFTLVRPTETVPAPEPEPVHPPKGLTARRFRPPWPAQVVFLENQPAFVECPFLKDGVRCAHGPFRSSGTWWKGDNAWAVEVWEVEVESGGTYRIARTESGWAVEGVLD
jgi:protein ImuB